MPKSFFLTYAPPPRPDSVLKRPRGIRPLLTLGSSARQAPLAGAAVMFVGTTLDSFVQKYMARDTKKKKGPYAAGRWTSPLALSTSFTDKLSKTAIPAGRLIPQIRHGIDLH